MSGVWLDVRCLVGYLVLGWISGVWVDVRCLDRERRGLKHEVHVKNISSYLTVNTLTLHYKDQLIAVFSENHSKQINTLCG